jgi:Zn-dependent alcohol dehydrogenase
MSFKEAALFGCALSTGCGMVLNYNKNKKLKNKIIVILGCGGIGLSILLMLTCMKLNKNIYVLDKNLKKLKKVKLFFKTIKTFSSVAKLKFQLFKNHNELADICFESGGSVKTIEQGFDLLNQKGSLIFASHPKKDQKIKLDPHQLISGKEIKGSWGGDCDPDKDIPDIYKITKKLLKRLIKNFCKVYKLKDINKAFKDLNKNKIFRPLIEMNH